MSEKDIGSAYDLNTATKVKDFHESEKARIKKILGIKDGIKDSKNRSPYDLNR